jgi:hypothetical protein
MYGAQAEFLITFKISIAHQIELTKERVTTCATNSAAHMTLIRFSKLSDRKFSSRIPTEIVSGFRKIFIACECNGLILVQQISSVLNANR